MKNQITLLFTITIIFLCSCSEKSKKVQGEVVRYAANSQSMADIDVIESIEISPISCHKDITALGMNAKLLPYDNGYLIAEVFIIKKGYIKL